MKFTYIQDHLKFTYIQDHFISLYTRPFYFPYIQDHFVLTNQIHKKGGGGGLANQNPVFFAITYSEENSKPKRGVFEKGGGGLET